MTLEPQQRSRKTKFNNALLGRSYLQRASFVILDFSISGFSRTLFRFVLCSRSVFRRRRSTSVTLSLPPAFQLLVALRLSLFSMFFSFSLFFPCEYFSHFAPTSSLLTSYILDSHPLTPRLSVRTLETLRVSIRQSSELPFFSLSSIPQLSLLSSLVTSLPPRIDQIPSSGSSSSSILQDSETKRESVKEPEKVEKFGLGVGKCSR